MSDRTHIKDTQDPDEIRLPGGDRFLIVPRVEEPVCSISLPLLSDPLLDLLYSPAM